MVIMATKAPTPAFNVTVSAVSVSTSATCPVQLAPPTTILNMGRPTVLRPVPVASTAIQLRTSATCVTQLAQLVPRLRRLVIVVTWLPEL